MKVIRLLLMIVVSLSTTSLFACTTWGAIGSASANHGLLIAKNRDSFPPSPEKLTLFHPKHGYRYIGLAYKKSVFQKKYIYLSAGINDQGLVVVNNAAATIATTHRDRGETYSIRYILNHFKNIKQVLADQKILFTDNKVTDLLIGDKTGLLLVEIGKDHLYHIWVKHNGILFHTNNYVGKNLLSENHIYYKSSVTRYHEIHTLLVGHDGKPLTVAEFKEFSDSHLHGPNDSIFRIGTPPHGPHTLATWIASIPKTGTAWLTVRFTRPHHPVEIYHVKLNKQLWKQDHLHLQDYSCASHDKACWIRGLSFKNS